MLIDLKPYTTEDNIRLHVTGVPWYIQALHIHGQITRTLDILIIEDIMVASLLLSLHVMLVAVLYLSSSHFCSFSIFLRESIVSAAISSLHYQPFIASTKSKLYVTPFYILEPLSYCLELGVSSRVIYAGYRET